MEIVMFLGCMFLGTAFWMYRDFGDTRKSIMCLFAALLCVIGLTYYSVATAPETLVSEETTDMFSPPLSQESVVVFDKPMKVRVLQKGLPLSLSVKWRYEVVTKEQ